MLILIVIRIIACYALSVILNITVFIANTVTCFYVMLYMLSIFIHS